MGKGMVSNTKELNQVLIKKSTVPIDDAKEFWKSFVEDSTNSPSVSQTLGDVDTDEGSSIGEPHRDVNDVKIAACSSKIQAIKQNQVEGTKQKQIQVDKHTQVARDSLVQVGTVGQIAADNLIQADTGGQDTQ
ncbi:Hypothetical predicted protein [Olea europaea subsp. europaea]|uniref:Uncharacterized protein n=1 Tax=Olea europaea subsp. europaea TaxID=158383 RepID=A0A8S0VDC9_OLEEU|nr:Hypothetical predicted protein [Olea europaea subsp. europaea]